MISNGVSAVNVAAERSCAPYGISPCPTDVKISRRDADRFGSMSYSSLIMNFVISVIIIYFCQDMMNGRELKSE